MENWVQNGARKKCTFSQFLTFEIERDASYVSGKITKEIPSNTKDYF